VTDKIDIRTISLEEITLFFKKNNEKPFRAKQVFEWLWIKSVRSFDKMSNIPKTLLVLLKEHFTINPVVVDQFYISKDRTIKFGFNLFDNNKVEGVLIPSAERITACVSTQVGCPLNCSFCATGKNGFIRNLTYAEIYDQVVLISEAAVREYKLKLSNIVYMGMGEPFLNYENTIESIKKITSSSGLAMSPQRITVSTAGLPDKIVKFADENINVKLAISLHSAIGYKRDILMPVNKKFTLSELSEALIYYHNKTKNRVTFEYLLLDGFNDTIDDAAELAKYCRSFPVKINLIEYNRVDDTSFTKSSAVKLEQFKNYLENKNMLVNIRKSKGEEIFAACGQLSNKK
jgi:23S rRNA (adenine2503-C2)-methyltransferase